MLKAVCQSIWQAVFMCGAKWLVGQRWGKEKALTLIFNELRLNCVPRTGVEPAHLSIYAPETYASTNSAIGAW